MQTYKKQKKIVTKYVCFCSAAMLTSNTGASPFSGVPGYTTIGRDIQLI